MNQYRILIVDDDPSIVEYIKGVLKKYNYELLTAYNGEVAVRIAQSSKPDLIITDWDMPIMNGIDTIKKIRASNKTRDIPIIMLTGIMNSIESFKEAFDVGANDFITKPINHIELISRTKSLLLYTDYFKNIIRQKEWELALFTKNQVRYNEFNNRIIYKLEELNESVNSNELLIEIIEDLKRFINTHDQEEFETNFNKVNPGFLKSLVEKHNNLTPNEIKLCVFLRLNLTSKEISLITYKNIHSIDIARYRLRIKIGLKRSEKLNVYLMNI